MNSNVLAVTKRYFVDRNGISTYRMQSGPGQGHYEATKAVEKLDPAADFYQQMFRLKYLRAAEDSASQTLYIDTPATAVERLTNAQRRWVNEMKSNGWTVVFNSREFIESRDAVAVVDKLLD